MLQLYYVKKVVKFKAFRSFQAVVTDRGTLIEADIILLCGGSVCNSDFMKEHFSSAIDDGKILIDEYFHVKGCNNIFALGDVTSIQEEKTAAVARQHGLLAAKNLKRVTYLNKKAKRYKPSITGRMTLSFGAFDGLLVINKSIYLRGAIPVQLKTRGETSSLIDLGKEKWQTKQDWNTLILATKEQYKLVEQKNTLRMAKAKTMEEKNIWKTRTNPINRLQKQS